MSDYKASSVDNTTLGVLDDVLENECIFDAADKTLTERFYKSFEETSISSPTSVKSPLHGRNQSAKPLSWAERADLQVKHWEEKQEKEKSKTKK